MINVLFKKKLRVKQYIYGLITGLNVENIFQCLDNVSLPNTDWYGKEGSVPSKKKMIVILIFSLDIKSNLTFSHF